ncbi:hypothetical protein ACU36R_02450 [Pectobacterium brasiliense]|uniref:hypothetical protein n=1 Tax=Pectobacterium brasiliense TaxID=180957 RepID=UPI0004E79E97|nr:hypothetical protein [Pectobacterium brasiliense]KFF65989.1 hypothetical protein IV99_07085 [Pectobacterium brasiliense]
MDVSTGQAITELQKLVNRLLESCGPVDHQALNFFDEGGVVCQGYVEYIHAFIEKAKESVRRIKVNVADFFRQLGQMVRRAQFILSKLSSIHFHTLVACLCLFFARLMFTRLFFARLASFRVPLFEYGPELSVYRHRFR